MRLLCALLVARAAAFAPASFPKARGDVFLSMGKAPTIAKRPEWKERGTLADEVGGAGEQGAAAVGLVGSIPVVVKQGNATKSTMAIVGQPISEVATQAAQFIKYKCRKGECGTCEVLIDGSWVRSCVSRVPLLPEGESYTISVRESMVKPTKKSSRFFSVVSFFSGFKNNLLGMVGFVRTGAREGKNFNHRISQEEELKAMVAARKAAKAAAAAGTADAPKNPKGTFRP